jgi:hypothetical protein
MRTTNATEPADVIRELIDSAAELRQGNDNMAPDDQA